MCLVNNVVPNVPETSMHGRILFLIGSKRRGCTSETLLLVLISQSGSTLRIENKHIALHSMQTECLVGISSIFRSVHRIAPEGEVIVSVF
jgi:hypothetical protein